MIDIKNTYTLLKGFEQVEKPASFLKDRYFPTDANTDVFNTDEVLVDYAAADGQTVAPFVAPFDGTSEFTRQWHHTSQFKPGLICPKSPITLDDLKRRGFGEAIFSDLTPEARELALIMRDLENINKTIVRREELMCAETLTTDGCVMTPTAGGAAHVIKFHSEEQNPYIYEPGTKWDQGGAKILGDIRAMIKQLTNRGLPATDLVISGDVEQMILANDEIIKLLDIRRVEIGAIEPKNLPTGAALIGTINVFGNLINIISYGATYSDGSHVKPILPEGTAIVTAPAAGRGLYGAVTQVEQNDGQFHTYKGQRVPKYLSDATKNTRSLQLSSAPLFIPRFEGGWISAKVKTE